MKIILLPASSESVSDIELLEDTSSIFEFDTTNNYI